jgi:hypothetical protein
MKVIRRCMNSNTILLSKKRQSIQVSLYPFTSTSICDHCGVDAVGHGNHYHFTCNAWQQQQQQQQQQRNTTTNVDINKQSLLDHWNQLEELLFEKFVEKNEDVEKREELSIVLQNLIKPVSNFFKYYGHAAYISYFERLNDTVDILLNLLKQNDQSVHIVAVTNYLVDICEILNLVDSAYELFQYIHKHTNSTLDYRSYENMVSLFVRANRDVQAWKFLDQCQRDNILTGSKKSIGYLKIYLPLYISLKIHSILSKEINKSEMVQATQAIDLQEQEELEKPTEPEVYAEIFNELEVYLSNKGLLNVIKGYARYHDQTLSTSTQEMQSILADLELGMKRALKPVLRIPAENIIVQSPSFRRHLDAVVAEDENGVEDDSSMPPYWRDSEFEDAEQIGPYKKKQE